MFSLHYSQLAGVPEPTTAASDTTTSAGDTAVEPVPDTVQPGTSGEASALTIDGIPIPAGVDPSFLEALPEAIRREVLAEQLGLHPPATQRNAAVNENEGTADLNVSPEFLAALPPDVQEEVRKMFGYITLLVQAFLSYKGNSLLGDSL